VREFPIFVPHDGQHIAAVVTVPDGEPRGLVALLAGMGAGRAHRFQVFTRMARALEELGIASVRLDWEGIGDSTGVLDSLDGSARDARLGQASAVLRVAASAIGTSRTAVVGNCGGARVALLLGAREPGYLGSACLLLRTAQGASQKALRRLSSGRILGAVRRNPLFRRVVVRRLKARSGMDQTTRASIASALSRGRLLLLYGEDDDALTERTREQMQQLARGLPDEHGSRYELRVLPVSRMAGFDSLETQRLTIEVVVGWLDSLFRSAEMVPDAAPDATERGIGRAVGEAAR
jgi:pimeloyl-ACP methyl ester carboxylesterase